MGQYDKETRRKYQAEYRAKRRMAAIRTLGGECRRCGVTEDLTFNHVNPQEKVFSLSNFWGSIERYEEELSKCELLCWPCHLMETSAQYAAGLIGRKPRRIKPYTHGTLRTYNHGCRCEECRARKRRTRP